MGSLAGIRESYCRRCPSKCAPFLERTLDLDDAALSCPIGRWQRADWREVTPPGERKKMGLGDLVEKLAKPIARALRLPCLDKDAKLKPQSPCAKRRDWLNRI